MTLIPLWRIVSEVLSEEKPSPRLILRVCERVTEEINTDLAKQHNRGGGHDLNVWSSKRGAFHVGEMGGGLGARAQARGVARSSAQEGVP
jgi:hypothetical protein